MLKIKVNSRGNGYFDIVDDKEEIATCYLGKNIKKWASIINEVRSKRQEELITPDEIELLEAESFMYETRDNYDKAVDKYNELKNKQGVGSLNIQYTGINKEQGNVSTDNADIR